MWSFVSSKGNKQWVWLALDWKSGEIVGCYVGERSGQGAEGLWQSLPGVYRQCAVCYTDFWSAYEEIFPASRHLPVIKKSGKTSLIELADTLLLFEKQERTRRLTVRYVK